MEVFKYRLGFVLSFFTGFLSYSQGDPSLELLRKIDGSNYFVNESGEAVLLTGSHTWANFQEIRMVNEDNFDWNGYLEMMVDNNHNFMRFWVWEQCWGAAWTDEEIFVDPLPYSRIGKKNAKDGKPKFDLNSWNQQYFDRLRNRVIEAGNNDIYVAIMLFQGWSLNKSNSALSDPYLGHPYNGDNNVNGVNFINTTHDTDSSATLHSLKVGEVLEYQKAYVKKIVETVNDLDNVLFEIINEGGAMDWQEYMVDYIREIEASLPSQHPIGITQRNSPLMLNDDMFNSNADWVSPNNEPANWMFPGTQRLDDYEQNPPANDGSKIVILDTDHLWGHGGTFSWAWKSFCRGHNPIFMDPWQHLPGKLNKDQVPWMFTDGGISKDTRDYPDWELLRYNMGVIKSLSEEINLKEMKPQDRMSSTGYCLTDLNSSYIVYFPNGANKETINLTSCNGSLQLKWYIPVLDRWVVGEDLISGGGYVSIAAPFSGEAVLILSKVENNN